MNNIEGNNKNKEYFILSDLAILFIFLLSGFITFISIMGALIGIFRRLVYPSIIILLSMPVIAFIFILPSVVGAILSFINKHIQKNIIRIIIFVISLLEVLLIIVSYYVYMNNGVMFWMSLVISIVLVIMTLIKVIIKSRK